MSLADDLQAARTRLRLSQEEAARRADVPLRSYQGYERGENEPRDQRARQIRAALGIASDLPETADVSADTSERPRMGPPMQAPASMADLVNDPEVLAGSPTYGLARVGGNVVARGYDEDGIMYAVEISFYVRPTARETRHDIAAASTTAGTTAPRPTARSAREAA